MTYHDSNCKRKLKIIGNTPNHINNETFNTCFDGEPKDKPAKLERGFGKNEAVSKMTGLKD